jgi:hypothetical protein
LRQSEGQIYERIASVASEKPILLGSIPTVVAAETFSAVSTSKVRKDLMIETHSREFTALVMTKLDEHINTLRGWKMWDVLWGTIESESLFLLAFYGGVTHNV